MAKIIFNKIYPSLNEIIDSARKNPFASNKQKKEFTEYTMYEIKKQKLKLEDKIHNYTFNWYCKDRRKDKDNIMAGQKYIFDGIVKSGVIKNDGWSEIGEIRHNFYVDKENPRVELVIEAGKQ